MIEFRCSGKVGIILALVLSVLPGVSRAAATNGAVEGVGRDNPFAPIRTIDPPPIPIVEATGTDSSTGKPST